LTEEPYRNRRIFVEAAVSRAEARFTIRDQGPGFDTSQLPDPATTVSHEKASGRGIILMRSIMDEVRYNAQGNEVTLVKRPPAVEELTAEEAAE
jgi:anti-sigma regulatory factor (Ser/Thr protein kinase)